MSMGLHVNVSGFQLQSNSTYLFPPPMSVEDFLAGATIIEENLTQFPYPGSLPSPKPIWEILVKTLCYAVTIVLAIVGNLLIIIIVWRNRRMHTTTNFYLVNLGVADLMVAGSCSWVHLTHDLTEGWVLGAFFCKFNSFAQVLSLVCSILTLTLIACDRFFGIVFAMKAHFTERRARTCLILVWFGALAVSWPLLLYRQQFKRHWMNHTEIWCTDLWPLEARFNDITNSYDVTQPSRTAYYTFITALLFFFPILVMSIAYSFVILRLWAKRYPGERIESGHLAQNKIKRKVVLMLVVLLVVFVICWLPFQVVLLYAEYTHDTRNMLPSWYPTLQFAATFLAHSNSAINPVIYAGLNENFKRGFFLLIGVRRLAYKRGSVSWKRDSISIKGESSFRTATIVTRL